MPVMIRPMPDDWYYSDRGERRGPVPAAALRDMLRDGRLAPTEFVWRDGMPEWLEAGRVEELTGRLAYFTPVPAGATIYAGFWLRFVAYVVDALILAGPGMLILFLFEHTLVLPVFRPQFRGPWGIIGLGGRGPLVELVLAWLYFALMESSTYRATPGKMLLGLVVTDTEGRPLTFGRATGRFFGKLLSRLTLGIGYVMAGLTEKKQALHDMLANALVVRKDRKL